MAQSNSCISGVNSFSAVNAAFSMTVNPRQDSDPDNKLRKIANWFTSVNFRSIQHDTFSKHTHGTGTWFIKSPEFQDWLSKDSGLLWAKGSPGAGKTILSSVVIYHLQEYCPVQETPVIFAYSRYSNRYSITDILASFIKQLAQDNHSIILPIIEPIYDGHQRKETRPSKEELWDLLKKLFNLFKKTYIIIDALDEIPDDTRAGLLAVLLSLQASRGSLLLTSRPLQVLEPLVPNAVFIHVEAGNWSDIELFIDKQIDENLYLKAVLRGNETDRKEICAKLKQKSQGMFLLASLQIDSLKHCISIKKLLAVVESLPLGLNAMYERTWKRIKDQTDDEVSLAERVIIWLTYAHWPLRVTELQHAVAVSDHGDGFDEGDVTSEELIVSVCCGLIMVDQQSRIVRLVHYTAYDFFRQYSSGLFARPHTFIANRCIAYLSSFGFAQQTALDLAGLQEFLARHPLLHYAYRRWGCHSKACYGEGGLPAAVIAFLAQWDSYPYITDDYDFDLLKPSHIAACYGLSDRLPPATNEWCVEVSRILQHTALTLASANGHKAFVEKLLSRNNININSQSKDGRTALFAASRNGHEEIVKLLLSQSNINPTIVSGFSSMNSGQTALLTASQRGHEAIVKLLLSRNDVDINSRDDDGRTALFLASCYGHEGIVKLLLSRNDIAINSSAIRSGFWGDTPGRTPLLAASSGGHKAIVKLLLSRNDVDINSRDDDGRTALFLASFYGHEEIVKLLLSHNIAINTTTTQSEFWIDTPGQTPLLAASSGGHKAVVELLLSRNDVDINSRDDDGRTALFLASCYGHKEIVKLLLSRNDIAINTTAIPSGFWGDAPGQTPLLTATRRGHKAIVELLLSRNDLDINSQDKKGRTALFLASSHGYEEIVKLLLSRNDIAINTTTIQSGFWSDTPGQTPLLAGRGEKAIVKLLVSRDNLDINSQDEKGRTALFLASFHGHEEIVKLLLSQTNIAINKPTIGSGMDSGQTALLTASQRGHEAIVKLLLSRNDIDINSRDDNGRTALFLASFHGHEEIVKLLLSQNNIAINTAAIRPGFSSMDSGQTPLLTATRRGHKAIVKLLLSRNDVDINSRDDDGRTALFLASFYGHEEIVKLLISRNDIAINTTIRSGFWGDTPGQTPLLAASRRGHKAIVKLLLSRNDVDINSRDDDGRTALFLASFYGHEEIVKLLLSQNNIAINTTAIRSEFWGDTPGQTPLLTATRRGHKEVVKMLLSRNDVDINSRDEDGRTALFLASFYGHEEIVELLLSRTLCRY